MAWDRHLQLAGDPLGALPRQLCRFRGRRMAGRPLLVFICRGAFLSSLARLTHSIWVRKGWRTAAILAIAIGLWRILDDHSHILAQIFNDPFLAHDADRTDLIADALLWGCCLSFWLGPPLRELLSPVRSTALAVGAAGSIVGTLFYHVNHMQIPLNLLPTVLLAAIIAAPNVAIGRILELSVLRFIGRLSYSLYIWQQLFLGGPGPTLSYPVALLAILACALFSHGVVEQPFIRLGFRLCHKDPEPVQRSVALPQTSKVWR
jgi:peptidoglycan/LPS O-acetylase OafA/YrhL